MKINIKLITTTIVLGSVFLSIWSFKKNTYFEKESTDQNKDNIIIDSFFLGLLVCRKS